MQQIFSLLYASNWKTSELNDPLINELILILNEAPKPLLLYRLVL